MDTFIFVKRRWQAERLVLRPAASFIFLFCRISFMTFTLIWKRKGFFSKGGIFLRGRGNKGGGAVRSMKHYEKRKTAKNSKGFYIALSLCLVAVASPAWTTFDSVNNFTAGEDVSSQVLQTEKTISGVKVPSSSEESSSSREESSQPESTVSETSSEAQSSQGTENSEAHVPAGASSSPAPSTVTPDILQYPLGNSISVPFSGDALVFSETMQDWRAHTGVDIPGKEGDAVKACAAGIVERGVRRGALWPDSGCQPWGTYRVLLRAGYGQCEEGGFCPHWRNTGHVGHYSL